MFIHIYIPKSHIKILKIMHPGVTQEARCELLKLLVFSVVLFGQDRVDFRSRRVTQMRGWESSGG